MILTITGRGAKTGEIPASLDTTLDYIKNVPDFLRKIEEVDTIKPLSLPGAYLVTHHPIGAFNFYVTVVSCLQAEMQPSGMVIRPLDFDLDKIKSDHQVLKGYVDGTVVLDPKHTESTHIDFKFTLAVEFPVPGALRLVPHSMVQSTADGIMSLRVGNTVQSLYRKVLDDFKIAAL